MKNKQRGYTLVELLVVLGMLLASLASIAVVGVLVWALIRFVIAYT